jgi:2-oxoglutarate dehydrogenase E1 component
VHGDAAFAGQGVVFETLNLSDLKGYRTGGTVHLVINNQLGFTTAPEYGRSSVYATDVAKAVQAPILHVNGDDPEACVRVARLAFAFRQAFHKDVVIDMWCYRRHGHNEGDDPSYTQPVMYQKIEQHQSVRTLYVESLVRRGDITAEEAERALVDFATKLQGAFDETRAMTPPSPVRARAPERRVELAPSIASGVSRDVLDRVFATIDEVPDDFAVHPKLVRQFDARREMWQGGTVDWALAEALAFGSVLVEGHDIRITGQDTRRGTFSQRHAVLVDHRDGAEYAPLTQLGKEQGKFWIYDSSLSEYAAMGFEYGYSIVHTDALVCWEAQFGDFVNGAQIIVDQFLVAGLSKWGQTSRLTLLLPHGYEGNGPEHSSAKLERFLQLAAQENIRVANCTTAAQYFHLVRRQALDATARPLVVMTPKGLLRLKQAGSTLADLSEGRFEPMLDDPGSDHAAVERLVLCSGKLYYDIQGHEDRAGAASVAVARLEQLYPFPVEAAAALTASYPNLQELIWVQEEPQNMGAWRTIRHRLEAATPDGVAVQFVGRPWRASPSEGYPTAHRLEQDRIVREALGTAV